MNSDYLTEAENASLASYAFVSNREWLEIFPQQKSVLIGLRDGWFKERERLQNIYKRIERDGDIVAKITAHIRVLPEIDICNKNISRLSALLALAYPSKKQCGITQEHLIAAKQVPIQSVLGVRVIKIRCPFHKEKTPSFTIYRKTNSWYCFGCNEHGDVIDLVRKLQCLSFKEAVTYLLSL